MWLHPGRFKMPSGLHRVLLQALLGGYLVFSDLHGLCKPLIGFFLFAGVCDGDMEREDSCMSC